MTTDRPAASQSSGFALEPVHLIVGHFHDVGDGQQAVEAGAIGRLVPDETGANVGVEIDCAVARRPLRQRLVSRAAGLGYETDPAQRQRFDGAWQRGQIVRLHHAAGACLVVERIMGVAVGQAHEGQRCGAIGLDQEVGGDPGILQTIHQHVAEQIRRDAGYDAYSCAQPPQRHGAVESRAAANRHEGFAPIRRRSRHHVDQRIAAGDDHGCGLTATISISTSAPTASAVTPTVVRAGSLSAGKWAA